MPCIRLNFTQIRNKLFCHLCFDRSLSLCHNGICVSLICLYVGFIAFSVFFIVLKTCSYALTPPRLPALPPLPLTRTKCAECGHSCWAGLPTTVRVSETPLQIKEEREGTSDLWGSTLSLALSAWFYHYIATATNFLTQSTDWMTPGFLNFPLTKCHYPCGLCGSCVFNSLNLQVCLSNFMLLQTRLTLKGMEVICSRSLFALGIFAWTQKDQFPAI